MKVNVSLQLRLVITSIMKLTCCCVILCLYLVAAIKNNTMPTMEHIDSLRAGSRHANVAVKALNKKAYFFFFEHLLENVAGKRLWKKQKYMAEVSKCVSVSDEGYCLLLLINSYQLYAKQATKEKGDKCVVKPKYTGQHGSNKCFEGWTHEGLLAYNDICQKLVKDRPQRQ